MCILAIQYKTVRGAPILMAHNREERFDRPTQAPKIQSGKPRVICGIDRKAGGTWLGVNQHGMLVVAANRVKTNVPLEPRSRGLLCRELLGLSSARRAVQHAVSALASGSYAGVNYLCADAHFAAVVYGGNHVETKELAPGLHILANGNMDDPADERQEFIRRQLTLQKIESAVTFLAMASRAFSRKPDVSGRRGAVLVGPEYGTVSSTLISLPRKVQNSVFQYTAGPPCDTRYDDFSALLRQVLSTDKNKEAREAARREQDAALAD
ncbi:MAG TPA: NRDE family protein [Thermoguttaceae bacterium]|nr:NRDE family protein [Thermoguttaceae bacterium]